jgi:hypothetical protein
VAHTWTLRSENFPSGEHPNDAAGDGAGDWVAVGSGGRISVSTDDGATWTGYAPFDAGATMRAVAFGNGYWVAVGEIGSSPGYVLYTATDPASTWTSRTISGRTVDGALTTVAYAASTWVAAGGGNSGFVTPSTGVASTGSDPTTGWAQRSVSDAPGHPSQGNFGPTEAKAAHGGGAWVIAGNDGGLAVSADGTAWANYGEIAEGGGDDDILFSTLFGVAYGNGVFMVVGDRNAAVVAGDANGTFIWNSDPTDMWGWTAFDHPLGLGQSLAIAYGDGFMTVEGNAHVSYSPDGFTGWEAETFFNTNGIYAYENGNGLGYAGGMWVAAGSDFPGDGFIATAPGGPAGQTASPGLLGQAAAVVAPAVREELTGPARLGRAVSAVTPVVQRAGGETGRLIFFERVHPFVASGPGVPPEDAPSVAAIDYGGGKFVAVADRGLTEPPWIATSNAGVNWTDRGDGGSGLSDRCSSDIVYGNGMWVIVGDSGRLITSPDGINWTQRTSSFGSTHIMAVAYGGGVFVAVGKAGKLATSTNGINWTQRSSGLSGDIRAVAYDRASRWVAVAIGPGVDDPARYTTTLDPTGAWTSTGVIGTGEWCYAVAYGNGVWIATTSTGVWFTAENGKTWTRHDGLSPEAGYRLHFGGGLFLTTGFYGAAYSTINGNTWRKETTHFAAEDINAILAVTYGNGRWAIGGEGGSALTGGGGPSFVGLEMDGTTTTLPLPAGAQAGDLAIIVAKFLFGTQVVPAGYTLIAQSGSSHSYGLAYRVLQAGDTEVPAWGSATNYAELVAVYRGINPITPIADVNQTSGLSGGVNWPAQAAGDMVVAAITSANAVCSADPGDGTTVRSVCVAGEPVGLADKQGDYAGGSTGGGASWWNTFSIGLNAGGASDTPAARVETGWAVESGSGGGGTTTTGAGGGWHVVMPFLLGAMGKEYVLPWYVERAPIGHELILPWALAGRLGVSADLPFFSEGPLALDALLPWHQLSGADGYDDGIVSPIVGWYEPDDAEEP